MTNTKDTKISKDTKSKKRFFVCFAIFAPFVSAFLNAQAN